MGKNREKTLMALTIPIFLELLLVTVVGNVDTIMLGKYSDKAVGAVGGISQVLLMQNVIFSFICIGTTILISQYIGAKKDGKIQEVVTTSFIINIVVAILLGGAYILGIDKIFAYMKLPQELIGLGYTYFKLVGGLCIFQAMSLTSGAIMKAYGHTKEMLYINIGVNLINILGNGMFIFGWFGAPILGVTGVGISTVFARFIGCIAGYLVLIRTCNLRFSLEKITSFPRDVVRNILKIGIPTASEHLCWSVAQMIILSYVNTMGAETITARTYLTLVASFVMTFSIALGHGTAIQVGRLVGAGETEKVYNKCLSSSKLAFLLATITSVVIYLLGDNIIGFFTADPKVIEISRKVFVWFIFIETGRVFNIVVINSLHAAGDIKFPAIMAVLSMLGIAVPLSYIFGIKLSYGLVGVWIANGVDEWVRAITMLLRWKSRKWVGRSFV